MGKALLILGNGFDLAHGLPTSYPDFLEFAKRAFVIYTFSNHNGLKDALLKFKRIYIKPWKCDDNPGREYLKKRLVELFESRNYREIPIPKSTQYNVLVNVNDNLDKFYKYLKNNVWYDYIQKIYTDGQKIRGQNWIDFESEISHVIQIIDNKHISLTQSYSDFSAHLKDDSENYDLADPKVSDFLQICNYRLKVIDGKSDASITVETLRTILYDDLEKLVNALEIYLIEFAQKFPVSSKIPQIDALNPDYVISFNYTKTYEMHYGSAPICHIHGDCGNAMNNIVLGIDEYVEKENQSKQVDFAIFKKFIQRIRKHNDVSYVSWAEDIEKAGKSRKTVVDTSIGRGHMGFTCPIGSDIYVFGHSLDVTDKDILKRFFILDNTRVHIFTRNKASEGKLITNLLRIMDEDMVIRKANTNPPMIEFIDIVI